MGNWRTVNITGTMTEDDAARLRGLLDYGRDYMNRVGSRYACLGFSSAMPGICGLGDWPAAVMDRSGNLHERDYSVQDVADALSALVGHAPSMLLKVHCGGEYESDECVATVSVGEGVVRVGKPEVEKISGPSEAQMMSNLLTNMMRP